MKIITSLGMMTIACITLLVQGAGCATSDDDEPTTTETQSQPLAGRPSFLLTCEGGAYSVDNPAHPTAFTRAFADSCLKADGKRTGFPPPTWGPGRCTDDIANCNGRLICGRC
jgi:hypothetical protein